MTIEVIIGVLIPFLGTSFGAASVFFVRESLSRNVQRSLMGFAGGVMVAASIWSLIIPALEQCKYMGKFAFVPVIIGFWCGTVFLFILDKTIPHIHVISKKAEGVNSRFLKTTMMIFAVTLHNIPEGMAVGVIYAGFLTGSSNITLSGALTLAIGIAIQNLPEGAIISLPLKAENRSKIYSFMGGVVSGIVEPIGALLTIVAASMFVPVMPYLLSFAASAMIYVVVEEMIPEMSLGQHSNVGVIMFSVGFTLMMILDIAFG